MPKKLQIFGLFSGSYATDEEVLEAMVEIPGMPFLLTENGAFMCSANNTILLI